MNNKSPYNYHSHYRIEGFERFNFDSIAIPLSSKYVSELTLAKEIEHGDLGTVAARVSAYFSIRPDVDYDEPASIAHQIIENECQNLAERLAMHLLKKGIYLPKFSLRHMRSSYPACTGSVSASISLYSEKDYDGEDIPLIGQLLEHFEEGISAADPNPMLLGLLSIEDPAFRFTALYSYLQDGRSIKCFMKWLTEKGYFEKYHLSFRDNPIEKYAKINPQLDDLSYMRTIIAHLKKDKASKFIAEHHNTINKALHTIIFIIMEEEVCKNAPGQTLRL